MPPGSDDGAPPWAGTLALGRLYALAGAVFRDDFVFDEEWPESWRDAESTANIAALQPRAQELLAAYEAARGSPQDTIRERSALLLTGGCPAYETVYTHPFTKTTDLADIAGFYTAFGLCSEGERGDHLAVESEFVGVLALKQAIATASGLLEEAELCRKARGSFLADHFGTWLGLYQADLGSRSRLLTAALATLRELVLHDSRQLGQEIHERERTVSAEGVAELSCASAPAGAP